MSNGFHTKTFLLRGNRPGHCIAQLIEQDDQDSERQQALSDLDRLLSQLGPTFDLYNRSESTGKQDTENNSHMG